MSVLAVRWWDGIADNPLEATLALCGLAAVTVVSAVGLRVLNRRARSLRRQVLATTFAALAIGALAATLLARLMILDSSELARVAGVLGVTAVVATVLVLLASVPLGRDVRRLETTVRRLEEGDRTVRTGVERADELGHVARALDELTARLDALERERVGYETERNAMLSSVGHDLRTPLAALRVAVDALVDGVAPDPERYLQSMRRDVDAVGALVDDLFLLARIEGGRLDLHPVAVDLTEIADEAVEALAPAAAAQGVTLTLEASARVHARGNPTALGRVVRNLVDNAIRHAPSGSVVQVAVAADGCPSVRVVDEGPGFPPDFGDEAFERFSRADASRNRATGGAGLGLAIAKGLIEAHGGRIWIEAPPGGRVAFELPAA
jgi:signal transduction histidine kinase